MKKHYFTQPACLCFTQQDVRILQQYHRFCLTAINLCFDIIVLIKCRNEKQLVKTKMLRVVQDLPTNIPHDPADPNPDTSGHLPNHTNDRQSALPVTCIETRMLNTVSGSSPSSMMFAVNHSFLDITALIPSPNWLIGVDSLELCKDGD